MSSILDSAFQRAVHLWGKADAIALAPHAKAYDANLRDLTEVARHGKPSQRREAQNTVLRSYSSKLTCLVRTLEASDGWTPEALQAGAGSLNAFQDCGETIQGWSKPKTPGNGWRPLCSFGPKRRALHLLCGDIVAAKYGVSESNYLVRKRGPDVASTIVQKLIDGGFEWFVVADIKDFYRSVQHMGLAKLTGLPQNVVTNSVTISVGASVSLSPIPHLSVLNGAVRAGLPQGSGASNQIAGLLLGTVLEQFAPAERTLYYGDDVLFAASDEIEAKDLEKALLEQIKAHPCGPFRLKRSVVAHIDKGFDFLKYHYRRDQATGATRICPSDTSYSRYEDKVRNIHFYNAEEEAQSREDVYTDRWVGAFPHWHANEVSLLNLSITADRGAHLGRTLRKFEEDQKSSAHALG